MYNQILDSEINTSTLLPTVQYTSSFDTAKATWPTTECILNGKHWTIESLQVIR